MPNKHNLNPTEIHRLNEAIDQLTTTLEWTIPALARYQGYADPSTLYRIRKGETCMIRERFARVMDLVENCTLPPGVVGDKATRSKVETEGDRTKEVAKTNARRFKSLTEGPIERRLNQGIPIFVYLQSARDQLDEVVQTFEDALEHSNVLTAPGIKEFRGWVKKLQSQLDEALAKR